MEKVLYTHPIKQSCFVFKRREFSIPYQRKKTKIESKKRAETKLSHEF